MNKEELLELLKDAPDDAEITIMGPDTVEEVQIEHVLVFKDDGMVWLCMPEYDLDEVEDLLEGQQETKPTSAPKQPEICSVKPERVPYAKRVREA